MLLLLTFLLAAAQLRLGEPVPEIPVSDTERSRISLSAFTGKQPVLILASCARQTIRQASGAAVLRLEMPDPALGRAVLLVDKQGVLRRIERFPGVEPAPADLVRIIERWLAGKSSFETACARCHGDDGSSTDYPFIKKLTGIGNRLTEDQIRDRLHPLPMRSEQYSVRSHLFRSDELSALIAYVAGL